MRKDKVLASDPTVLVAGLAVCSAAGTAWLAVLLGTGIDAVLGGAAPGRWWYLWVLLAVLLAAVGSCLVPVAIEKSATRMQQQQRAVLLEHYLAIGPLALRRGGQGERVNTAMDAVDRVVRYRAGFTGPALAAVLTPILVVVFIAVFIDALAAGILALLLPLVPLIVLGFQRLFRSSSGQYRRSQGVLAAVFMDALTNLGMLKLNNASGWMGTKVAAAAEQVRVQVMKLLARNQLVLLVIDGTFAVLLLATAAILAWWRTVQGVLEPGAAVSLVILSFLLLAPVNYVGSFFYIGMTGKAAAAKITAELSTEVHPAMLQPVKAQLGARPLLLQDVAASYDQATTAISAINLSFPPGSRTAIIGPSGSGKTTLLRLLGGQLETSAGLIHDSRQALGTATLRLNTAVVDQSATLFAMSLRQNLALADAQASDEEMVAMLDRVGLGEWFADLEQGLDLELGEAGARLSGGQGQRLALARALLAERPLLLLDEPTSALDVRTEAQVLATLRQLGATRSIITVTHRLGLLKDYDRVVVMSGGKVLEAGRREQLLAAGGYLSQAMAEYLQRTQHLEGEQK